MEFRNGVFHVKVNLKSSLQVKPKPTVPSNRPKQTKHQSAISLNIPSGHSPRLIKVKENLKIFTPNNETPTHLNSSHNRFQNSLQDPKSPSSKIKLNYYANIFTLPSDLGPLNEKFSKISCKNILKSRKALCVVSNMKF